MIKFPEGYIAIPNHPGYFWKSADERVYSIKRGTLRKLRVNHVWIGLVNKYKSFKAGDIYFELSVNGIRKYVFADKLKLMADHAHTIGIHKDV